MYNEGVIAKLAQELVETSRHLREALVHVRKQNRLTQEDMANRMCVTQPSVAAFERYDANPTLSSIERYALAAGASIRFEIENVYGDESWDARRRTSFDFRASDSDVDAGTAWPRLTHVGSSPA